MINVPMTEVWNRRFVLFCQDTGYKTPEGFFENREHPNMLEYVEWNNKKISKYCREKGIVARSQAPDNPGYEFLKSLLMCNSTEYDEWLEKEVTRK